MKTDHTTGNMMRSKFEDAGWMPVFMEMTKQAGDTRMQLLWNIIIESDLHNLQELEEMIYCYGSNLGAKDVLGRYVFTRMVMALRNMQAVQ